MKIMKRLLKVQAAVAVNKVEGDGSLGVAVGDAAERAMIGGMKSDEWKVYMSLFADSADQLRRLTTTELDAVDDDHANYLPRIRAYIVANGICAPGTDAATAKGLMGFRVQIDADKPGGEPLNEAPDPAVVALRPVNIP